MLKELFHAQNIQKSLQTAAVVTFLLFETLWLTLYLAGVIAQQVGYIGIVASFIFSVIFLLLWTPRKREHILLTAGLLGACIADIFLVFLFPMNQGKPEAEAFIAIGMILFFGVQTIYFFQMHYTAAKALGLKMFKRKLFWIDISIRATIIAGMSIAAIPVFWGHAAMGVMLFVAIFYVVHSVANIALGAFHFKHNPLLPVGLALLLICDAIIGAIFLKGAGLDVRYIADGTQWLFYIPSQTILALAVLMSGKKFTVHTEPAGTDESGVSKEEPAEEAPNESVPE